MVYRDQFQGRHSVCSTTFTLYVYSKTGLQKKKTYEDLVKEMLPGDTNNKVKHAFEFHGKFHNVPKDVKENIIKTPIKDLKEN